MIIAHEGLENEAELLAGTLRQVYGLQARVIGASFISMEGSNGFLASNIRLLERIVKENPGKATMIVTPRDIYVGNNLQNDWIMGYDCGGLLQVVSTARLKRQDNQPSDILEIPSQVYNSRLNFLGIHEVGHAVVKAPHHQKAFWVNNEGYKLALGDHCTDNRCVMYEFVDIKSPNPNEGHLLLGSEKKFDAGIDNILSRIHKGWFCKSCKNCIKLDGRFN